MWPLSITSLLRKSVNISENTPWCGSLTLSEQHQSRRHDHCMGIMDWSQRWPEEFGGLEASRNRILRISTLDSGDLQGLMGEIRSREHDCRLCDAPDELPGLLVYARAPPLARNRIDHVIFRQVGTILGICLSCVMLASYFASAMFFVSLYSLLLSLLASGRYAS
ncbi:hypothetical protein MRB53_037135 [Persea americana]|nr:hypothetical protein MRB53_037135 [Persea americana]